MPPPTDEETRYPLLAAIAADWSRLEPLLSADLREPLAAGLRALRAAPPGSAEQQAAAEAVGALPGPWSAENDGRFSGTPTPPPGFLADDLAVLVLDRSPMVGPLLGPVRRRLLAEPAVDAAEFPALTGEPLIRLRGEGGRLRLPAFQFAGPGEPWPVVSAVNTLLDAGHDPWGVADWWCSPNAWLGGSRQPRELLGSGRDGEIACAAGYLDEGE